MGIVISGNKNLKFIKSVYYQPVQPIPDKYLTIEAIEDDTYIGFEVYTEGQVWYSFDKRKWTEVVYTYHEYYDELSDEYWEEYTQENEFPILSAGQKLYIKGTLGQSHSIYDGIGQFGIGSPYNLSGNCNSLVFCDDADKIFDLNQVSVPWGLYYELFANTPLINISENFLPATTLADGCYESMFRSCELHNYPKLPATTLADICYAGMFMNCIPYINEDDYDSEEEYIAAVMNIVKNLKIELPAEELTNGCYDNMFSSSLINEITASFITEPGSDNIGNWLYGQDEFYEIYQAFGITPKLILRDDIEWDPENYRDGYIFPYTWEIEKVSLFTPVECTSLSITANNVPWDKTNTTIYYTAIVNGYDKDGNWVIGKEIKGEAVSDPFEQNLTDNTISRMISFTYLNKTVTITILQSKFIKNYFTVEALEDGLQIKLSTNDCQYSLDDMTWINLPANTNTPTINRDQKIYFRGNLTPTTSAGIGAFNISERCNISGNIMSLLFGDDFEGQTDLSGKNYAFYKLFYNCTNIIDASQLILPATTLASRCYYSMFQNCTSLRTAPALLTTTLADSCYNSMFKGCTKLATAPELPATTLTQNCYFDMFSGCQSLVTAPALPATTLAANCYYRMFDNCTSLRTAPELPATTLANYCYESMFYGCYSLASAPELPATTLAEYCYEYMFYGCTKLTTAPELPATTLVKGCYRSMFDRCTSLTQVPELPATTLVYECYAYMFDGCTSLVNAPELPAPTLAEKCYYYMFNRCSSLTQAPELPAINLTDSCYYRMFDGCTSLNYIKMLATDISASNCLNIWVNGVSSTGTFVKNKDATWNVTGVNGIPTGWTVQTA